MSAIQASAGCANPLADGGNEQRGWEASLQLTFEATEHKTFVRRRSTGPYNIQRPFYPEGAVGHVYLLHPPGGLVGGDSLSLDVHVAQNAHGLLTTPGASRFYRSKCADAIQQQVLTVNGGALEWLPQETIYFSGCQARTGTEIHLQRNARFLGWELQCLGRPASQAPFISGSVTNCITLYKDQKMLLRDRLHIDAPADVNRIAGLRGSDVHGLFLATQASQSTLDLVRTTLEGTSASATLIQDLLLVRYLGTGAESARALFADLWRQLRPLVMARSAYTPRIWST